MSTTNIKIISPDCRIRRDSVPSEEGPCLAAMKLLIGGGLEIVPVPGSRYLVLHAEGKILNLAPNPIATKLARDAEFLQADDYIAGTALLAPRKLFG